MVKLFLFSNTYNFRQILLTGCMASALILAAPAMAQEDSLDDLLDLDLKSLMDVEVTTASKKAEKISEAPGVVSVVTAKDIKRFGAQTLFDVLGRMPNVYTFGSLVFNDNAVSVRGGNNTHVDNRVLILINGRPSRESRVGGQQNSVLYRSFPVELIERVEMIRGPGSVLYGSNAFSGVINVITKDLDSLETNSSVSVGYGSFGTKQVSGTYGDTFLNGELEVVVSGQAVDNQGEQFNFIDVSSNPRSYSKESDNHSGFVEAKYKNFTLTGFSGYENLPRSTTGVTIPIDLEAKARRLFVDLGYTHGIGGEWKNNYNITYNKSTDSDSGGSYSKDFLAEISTGGPIGDRVNLLVGAVIDNHDVGINAGTTDYDFWYSSYAQIDLQATDWLKFVLGIQMNAPEGLKKDYSPRAGAIMQFDQNWGMKLLYGEAFRSAYSAERAINSGTLVGNPDLKPEKIGTFDAQLFYRNPQYHAALTVYKSIQNDTIAREGTGPSFFVNGGDVVYKGVEFEGTAKINNEWELQGSLTWQGGEDDVGNKDVGLVPHWMGKVGVSYDGGRGYTLGVHNSYFSDSAKPEEFNNTLAVVNPDAKSYNWLSANLNVDVNRVMGLPNAPKMEFSLYGENLLDEDVYFPEVVRNRINTTPIRSGRAVFGKLTVKF